MKDPVLEYLKQELGFNGVEWAKLPKATRDGLKLDAQREREARGL